MRNKYVFVLVMLICISLICAGLTKLYLISADSESDDSNLLIVTSFYPMYIATLNVVDGADGVRLENLSEPQTGCLHDFTLTPEDMKLLSKADVFVINGGGVESFMEEVADAYPNLTIVEACEKMELLADEEEENAHAWMSVEYYRKQVSTIAKRLENANPENAEIYQKNAADYDEKLQVLQEKQEAVEAAAPAENVTGESENVVIFHEAFAYVAADYGMSVCGVMDLDEERQISAGEVADMIKIINENNVRMIFAEELYGSDMGATVEKETDVKVIYLDPLNRGEYDKDSYLSGMESNIDKLAEAIGNSGN